ncbi:MAG: GNAT family N-acetyltransferase [Actinomycetota bacterium]|nr:GNAT family N-acetyltransferase [Actinomycetota bacterium]
MSATGPVTVRRAVAAELATVGELTLAAYLADGHVTDEADYVHQLRDATARDRGAEVWVAGVAAGDREVLVGSVTFCPPGSSYREIAVDDDEAEFRMLAVSVGWRRRGIARVLTEHCLARARQLGQHRMVLCSDRRMTSAQALYAELGFIRIPERDWSPAPGFELLAFTLDLT